MPPLVVKIVFSLVPSLVMKIVFSKVPLLVFLHKLELTVYPMYTIIIMHTKVKCYNKGQFWYTRSLGKLNYYPN